MNTVGNCRALGNVGNKARLRHVKGWFVVRRPAATPNGSFRKTRHELSAAACERSAPAPSRSRE